MEQLGYSRSGSRTYARPLTLTSALPLIFAPTITPTPTPTKPRLNLVLTQTLTLTLTLTIILTSCNACYIRYQAPYRTTYCTQVPGVNQLISGKTLSLTPTGASGEYVFQSSSYFPIDGEGLTLT